MLLKLPLAIFRASACPRALIAPAVRAFPRKGAASISAALDDGTRKRKYVRKASEIELAIRSRLPDILQATDLETASEESIRGALTAELGTSVESYKDLIRGLTEEYLDRLIDGSGEANAELSAGAKVTPGPSAAVEPQQAKEDVASDSAVWDLSGNKRASVGQFKGKVQVDLREFYEDKLGQLQPGPKGISLTFDQWLLLKSQLPGLVDATNHGRETAAEPVQLSFNRQAYVQEFRSKYLVHVREMLEKEGSMLPGRKGVTLDAEGMAQLLGLAHQVTAAAEQLGAKSETEELPASSASSLPAAAPAKRQAMPKAIHPEASGTGAGAEAFVDLGSEKRATVTEFRGKTYVDLREYYVEGDGQKKPGKKGIMLSPEAFKLIVQNAAAISTALASPNASYELELGPKLKVMVAAFRGKMYVNVREFYEDKDGLMKPGIKGLAMSPEQWNKLMTGLPHIEAKLGPLA